MSDLSNHWRALVIWSFDPVPDLKHDLPNALFSLQASVTRAQLWFLDSIGWRWIQSKIPTLTDGTLIKLFLLILMTTSSVEIKIANESSKKDVKLGYLSIADCFDSDVRSFGTEVFCSPSNPIILAIWEKHGVWWSYTGRVCNRHASVDFWLYFYWSIS